VIGKNPKAMAASTSFHTQFHFITTRIWPTSFSAAGLLKNGTATDGDSQRDHGLSAARRCHHTPHPRFSRQWQRPGAGRQVSAWIGTGAKRRTAGVPEDIGRLAMVQKVAAPSGRDEGCRESDPKDVIPSRDQTPLPDQSIPFATRTLSTRPGLRGPHSRWSLTAPTPLSRHLVLWRLWRCDAPN